MHAAHAAHAWRAALHAHISRSGSVRLAAWSLRLPVQLQMAASRLEPTILHGLAMQNCPIIVVIGLRTLDVAVRVNGPALCDELPILVVREHHLFNCLV